MCSHRRRRRGEVQPDIDICGDGFIDGKLDEATLEHERGGAAEQANLAARQDAHRHDLLEAPCIGHPDVRHFPTLLRLQLVERSNQPTRLGA